VNRSGSSSRTRLATARASSTSSCPWVLEPWPSWPLPRARRAVSRAARHPGSPVDSLFSPSAARRANGLDFLPSCAPARRATPRDRHDGPTATRAGRSSSCATAPFDTSRSFDLPSLRAAGRPRPSKQLRPRAERRCPWRLPRSARRSRGTSAPCWPCGTHRRASGSDVARAHHARPARARSSSRAPSLVISPRVARPSCPSQTSRLARHLIDSELFGHERGAFHGRERAPQRVRVRERRRRQRFLLLDRRPRSLLANQLRPPC